MAQSEIKMKMSLDSSGVNKALGRAKASVKNFANDSMQRLGSMAKFVSGGLAAAFLGFSRKAIQLGSELSDIAISTGFATEQFQVFRGALIDAGGKAESMEKAITIMQKAIVQGSEGLTTYVRAFERLGLNVDDLRKMKPEDQFQTIGKAIAGAKDQQGALTAAIEIFGQRNAPRLIEVFKRLDKDGYGKMAKDIEAAYGIMDAETQKALDKAADTIERFKNKATIKVGELISGEGDGAAVKALGFELMAAAARFGGKILDGLTSVGQIIQAGIGGTLDYVADRFVNIMSSGIDSLRVKFGELALEIAEKNPLVSIEEFKEMAQKQSALVKEIAQKRKDNADAEQKSWSDFFEDAIPDPTDYAGDLSSYWEKLADEQRQILQQSKDRHAEEADSAEESAKAQVEAIGDVSEANTKAANTTVANAARKAEAEEEVTKELSRQEMQLKKLNAAARGLSGTKGLDVESMTTEELKFLKGQTTEEIDSINRQAMFNASPMATQSHKMLTAPLNADVQKINQELQLRNRFKRASERLREMAYSPFERSRLEAVSNPPDNKEQLDLLRRIDSGIGQINNRTQRLDRALQ
jgi:hypothetical protein